MLPSRVRLPVGDMAKAADSGRGRGVETGRLGDIGEGVVAICRFGGNLFDAVEIGVSEMCSRLAKLLTMDWIARLSLPLL